MKPTESPQKTKKGKFGSSNRAFGYTFALVFLFFTFSPLLRSASPRWFLLIPAFILFFIGSFFPDLLKQPAKAWLAFGHLLSKITAPIVAAAMFYIAFGISGILMRAFGSDPLHIRLQKNLKTYWKKREENPSEDSFYLQF